MARILCTDVMVNLWVVVIEEWYVDGHGRSLTKGRYTVNFSAVFCRHRDPDLSRYSRTKPSGSSDSRTFWNEAKEPGGRLLRHIGELASRAAGWNIGEDRSATNLN